MRLLSLREWTMLGVLIVNINGIGSALLALLVLIIDFLHPCSSKAAPKGETTSVALESPAFLCVVVDTKVTFETFDAEIYDLIFAFFQNRDF